MERRPKFSTFCVHENMLFSAAVSWKYTHEFTMVDLKQLIFFIIIFFSKKSISNYVVDMKYLQQYEGQILLWIDIPKSYIAKKVMWPIKKYIYGMNYDDPSCDRIGCVYHVTPVLFVLLLILPFLPVPNWHYTMYTCTPTHNLTMESFRDWMYYKGREWEKRRIFVFFKDIFKSRFYTNPPPL